MFRFFRSIRHKLFQEGKASRYLGYAIGEIVLIVIGILIAVQISEWNEAQDERQKERQILIPLLEEARANVAQMDRMVGYHQVTLDFLSELMDESVNSQPTLSLDLIDQKLSENTGYFIPLFERAALDATLLGGQLDTIQSSELRRTVANWNSLLTVALGLEKDHAVVVDDVWTPFLQSNANLMQISNAQTSLADGSQNYLTKSPVDKMMDHSELLKNQEFSNIMQRKKWSHEDALNNYKNFTRKSLNALILALETELSN